METKYTLNQLSVILLGKISMESRDGQIMFGLGMREKSRSRFAKAIYLYTFMVGSSIGDRVGISLVFSVGLSILLLQLSVVEVSNDGICGEL